MDISDVSFPSSENLAPLGQDLGGDDHLDATICCKELSEDLHLLGSNFA
jgi:hypothetical protein